MNDKIKQVIKNYNPKEIRIGVLGSHSALEIASGAKQEGLETVVVCQKGREKTYTKYYRNLFDHVIMLDKFSDITSEANVKKLVDLNTVFVPNRSFSVYAGYEAIENQFAVPLMGNRCHAADRRTQHTEKPALPASESWNSNAENLQVAQRNRPLSHRESS